MDPATKGSARRNRPYIDIKSTIICNHKLKSIDDIKSFRLTCKQTDQALATEVLCRITVNIHKENFEKELCKLQYLAEGSSSFRSILGIKQLDIKSLSFALELAAPTTGAEGGPAAETAYEEELKKCLHNALSSLTAVRTIRHVFHKLFLHRWIPTRKDSAWAHTVVVDALKIFPNLQSLHIPFLLCRIEIPFHSFTTLRHISVCCVSEDHPISRHQKTFENLAGMISQSPLLESIDFSNAFDRRTKFPRSLYQLLECYPESIPALRLKHLSLANCFAHLDDEKVMRHLRYLTSLFINDLLQPGDSDGDYIDNPDKSSHERLWRVIADADLRLEEIKLDTTPLAFVEYVGTYSGLKKLAFDSWDFDDKVESDTAAKKFFEALEKHAGSIEELTIGARYEGLWCFGHHNQALFSTFQNLKTLRMGIQPDDIVLSSEGDSSRHDIIEVLIDTVVTHMPHLQALIVCVASKHGIRANRHFAHYIEKAIARVLEYKAPWGCQRLPTFKLEMSPERTFVGQSLGERLRYL